MVGGGSDKPTDLGDGQPAVDFGSGFVRGMAAASDGTLYYVAQKDISGQSKYGMMRINPDGIRQVVMGFDHYQNFRPLNGQSARFTPSTYLDDVGVGPDDRPYFIGSGLLRVGKVLYPGDLLPPAQKPAVVEFELAAASVSEATSQFTFKIIRHGTAGYMTCNLVLTGGTASQPNPRDFTGFNLGIPTLVQLQADDREKTFTINLNNDTFPEGVETLEFELQDAAMPATSIPTDPALAAAARIGAVNKMVISIVDDELPPPFFAGFPSNAISVNESDGTVNLVVERTGSSSGHFNIDYRATGVTATAGQDFNLPNGTLSFADGETQKTIALGIVNDLEKEADETLHVTLENPTDGSAPGPISDLVVTINDDDVTLPPPGTVQLGFVFASSAVLENVPTATVRVRRLGPTGFPVSVDYAVTGGDATEGMDFTLADGTLSFASGETDQSITVPLINDNLSEPDETLVLSLSDPGGGAALGSPTDFTLTIEDDDGPVAPVPTTAATGAVVLSGAPVPGIPGAVFGSFSQASINNVGEVAFAATYGNPGGPFTSTGIWTQIGGQLQVVAYPGLVASFTTVFNGNIAPPIITDAGAVAFVAQATSGLGVFSWNNGQAHRYIGVGVPVFGGFEQGDVVRSLRPWILANETGYIGYDTDIGLPGSANTAAAFLVDDGVNIAVGKEEPEIPGSVVYGIYHKALHITGAAVISVVLEPGFGGVSSSDQNYVGYYTPGGPSIIARDGDPLSTAPGDVFAGVGTDGVSVNRAGDVLLTSVNGLFLRTSTGGLFEMVRNHTAATGAGTGAEFARFTKPLFNDQEELAFVGTLTPGLGGVIADQNDQGIWTGPAQALSLVARKGSPATGAAPGIVFESFPALDLNQSGAVAFLADCSNGQQGIWANSPCGPLEKVVFAGDTIDLGAGGVHEVATIQPFDNGDPEGPNPSSNGTDGRARFLNDRGEVAIAVSFTDGSSAVLVKNITAVNCALFSHTDVMVRENVMQDLQILRPGALNESLTLNVSVTGGSAIEGIDFSLPVSQVTFAADQYETMLPLAVLDDSAITDDKTVQLTLTDPATGNQSTITVTIVDPSFTPAPPARGPQIDFVGGRLRLTFTTKPGRTYVMEASSDLKTWLRTQRMTSHSPIVAWDQLIHPGWTSRFFRLRELFEAGGVPGGPGGP